MLWLQKIKSFISRGDYYRGLLYYQTGNYAKALPLLKLYEGRYGTDEDYLLRLVTCLLRQKNEKAARPLINKILKLNPDNVTCYALQAELFLRKKDYRMAKQFYEKIATTPKDYDFYQLLVAYCDLELKNNAPAEKAITAVIEKAQCLDSAYYLLARLNFKKEDFDTAAHHIKHSLSFYKKDNLIITLGRAYELNGDIQTQLGTFAAAAESYAQAIAAQPERKLTITYKLVVNEISERKHTAAKQKLAEIIKSKPTRKAYGLQAQIAIAEDRPGEAFEIYLHYLTDRNFNYKKLSKKHRAEIIEKWHAAGKKINARTMKKLLKDPDRKDLQALIKEYRGLHELAPATNIFK